ncbi:MAG: hypothetical protein H6621_09880 [Halobacteriovoraceae bacterium]|nr:hypothetical protein [Halobacteriovoraceae bacterium]MCB9095366.1 hypothetical protein [Halobacteriovoraceae bacterium]
MKTSVVMCILASLLLIVSCKSEVRIETGGNGTVNNDDNGDDESDSESEPTVNYQPFYIAGNQDYLIFEPDAIEYNGYIYLTSTKNKITKMSLEGEIVAEGGGYGTGDGQLNLANSMALHEPSGKIFVSNYYPDNIQVFDSDLKFLFKINNLSGNIAMDSSDRLWLFDRDDLHLKRLNVADGTILQDIDVSGTIPSFSGWGFLIDGSDNFYIARYSSNTIYKLDSSGSLITSFATASNPLTMSLTNGKTELVVAQYNAGGVYNRLDLSGNVLESVTAVGLGLSTVHKGYFALIDSDTNIHIFRTDGYRLYSSSKVLIKEELFSGDTDDLWYEPEDFSIDYEGNFIVGDKKNHKIKVYDSDRNFVRSFGSYGSGAGQLDNPFEAVRDESNGRYYVIDQGNDRIAVFSSSGSFLFNFGSTGAADGQFNYPVSLTITNNRVYVADYTNDNIQYFDLDGNFIGKFGATGAGDGQFNQILSITHDDDGKIYASEDANSRVQVFDSSHNFLLKFGTAGSGDGQLNGPWGISVNNNYVVVSENGNSRISIFDKSGNFIKFLIPGGWGTDVANSVGAFGVEITEDNYIYSLSSKFHMIRGYNFDGTIRMVEE